MRGILVALTLVLIPTNIGAIVIGGSNLGFGGYPSHRCIKPQQPFRPYSFTSQWQVDNYNAEVQRYNSQLQFYLDCIEDYVESAQNDIRRISQRINEAINEASGR